MDDAAHTLIGAWSAPAYTDLEIRGLRVFYGRNVVLSDLNLRLETGTVTALMGANGAGKSTVLRVLSTLLCPDAGEVVAGGQLRYRDHRRVLRATIGLVAHEPMLYDDLSARENLRLWADLYGLKRAPLDAWLRAVDLFECQHLAVSGFSRGMKQRLAIARTMLHEPTLVLMDEVLTGLDHASRQTIWALLEALRAAGRIVVVATHIFDHPSAAVNRGVVLRHGRLAVDAPAEEGLFDLYARGVRAARVSSRRLP